jgi:hypothetical protein
VAGGAGLSVINRSAPEPEGKVPIAIDLDDAATTAVVVLLDQHVKDDPDWIAYVAGSRRAQLFGGIAGTRISSRN